MCINSKQTRRYVLGDNFKCNLKCKFNSEGVRSFLPKKSRVGHSHLFILKFDIPFSSETYFHWSALIIIWDIILKQNVMEI